MIKIDRILSVSSEDPSWPAENLLKAEGRNTKWKCKSAGEKNATVVLQLEKATKIKSIDVGNENSAFIEILVGKSSLPDNDFKVLLVASSLMTLKEAKDVSNANGVRFFKESNFCKDEASEKWDRVKIVCSQPYNKYVQYGLSFVKFHIEADDETSGGASAGSSSADSKVTNLGRFVLKEKNEDDIAIGSIFARRKELQSNDHQTSAAAIRTASTQLLAKTDKSKTTPSCTKPAKKQRDKSDKDNDGEEDTTPSKFKAQEGRAVNGKRTKINDSSESPRTKKVKQSEAGPSRLSTERRETPPGSAASKIKKKSKRPFNEFMRGVTFTISGFQNPLRGDVRSKALEMGAKYKPDWDSTCTHLVCAFMNTPKYLQVKGHGKIVKKEWIEECYSKRIRFPWRRFSLDPAERKSSESEEEIFEGDDSANNDNGDISAASSSRLTPGQNQTTSSLFGDLSHKEMKTGKKKKPEPKLETTTVKKTPTKTPNTGSEKKKRQPAPKTASPIVANNKTLSGSSSRTDAIHLNLDLEEVDGDLSEGGEETEPDEDWMDRSEDSSVALPYLPEQFSELRFYISDDFTPTVKSEVKRYIVAHCGCIHDVCNEETEYVIAEKRETVEKLKERFADIIGVKPEWVWRCHDENRLLPTSKFEL